MNRARHESLLVYGAVEFAQDVLAAAPKALDVRFKRQAARLGLRRKFIRNVDCDYHVKTLARIESQG